MFLLINWLLIKSFRSTKAFEKMMLFPSKYEIWTSTSYRRLPLGADFLPRHRSHLHNTYSTPARTLSPTHMLFGSSAWSCQHDPRSYDRHNSWASAWVCVGLLHTPTVSQIMPASLRLSTYKQLSVSNYVWKVWHVFSWKHLNRVGD